jgi:hypothetical protein
MKKLICSLLALPVLLACETVIDFDVPAEPTRFVLHSMVLPDTSNVLYLSLSRNIYSDGDSYGLAPWATVQLISPTDTITLRNTDSEPSGFDIPKGATQVNVPYSIVVSYPYNNEISQASASFKIPEKVTFDFVETRSVVSGSDNYKTYFKIRINDSGSTPKYYLLRLAQQYYNQNPDNPGETYWYYSELESDYPGTTNIHINRPDLLINNNAFGQSSEIEVYDEYGGNPADINDRYAGSYLLLYHVTEDYYNYLLSANANEDAQDNPLAEPVQIKSNVEGGFGVVGGASLHAFKLPVIELGGK